jgi:nitrile hydratase
MTGFGPVEREEDEPVFHAEWEARVFGMSAALAVTGVITGMRHAIERMDGVHYLTSSYYEHWLTGVATRLVETGEVDRATLEERVGSFPLSRRVADQPVPEELSGDAGETPRFALGERVRVRNIHPKGHTRCPDYVRDRVGEIVRVDPPAPVPELDTHSGRRVMETVYGVRFATVELWGDGDPGESVAVDLYERYLEAPT